MKKNKMVFIRNFGILTAALFLTQNIFAYNDLFRKWVQDIEKYNLSLQEQKIKIDLYKTRRLTALEVPHSRGAIEIVSNGQVYTIEQRIPFPGKTVINELMLDKEYKIKKTLYENKKMEIIGELKRAYIYIYHKYKIILLVKEMYNMIDQMEIQILAQSMFGKMSLSRANALKIEKVKFQDIINVHEMKKKKRMNDLMNILNNNITAEEIETSLPDTKIELYDLNGLNPSDLVFASRKYRELAYNYSQKDLLNKFEFFNFFPELSARYSYANIQNTYSNEHYFSLAVNFPFPFPAVNKGFAFREARLNKESAEIELKQEKNSLIQRISNLITEYEMNKRSYLVHNKDLREITFKNLEEVKAQFIISSQVTSADFLEAFRKYIFFQEYAIDYLANMEYALHDLEDLICADITEVLKK
ncbi:MAG: hypothetical protein A2096_11535 [Spirochaetes bacterium GWF1_41_5]|nr:MAG: hypothetical protein A2096_11535 [Spirochaetes bacterium GWF1_41_5]HBE01476.1 hypothetical protein [Spirochaetia bacterium]